MVAAEMSRRQRHDIFVTATPMYKYLLHIFNLLMLNELILYSYIK